MCPNTDGRCPRANIGGLRQRPGLEPHPRTKNQAGTGTTPAKTRTRRARRPRTRTYLAPPRSSSSPPRRSDLLGESSWPRRMERVPGSPARTAGPALTQRRVQRRQQQQPGRHRRLPGKRKRAALPGGVCAERGRCGAGRCLRRAGPWSAAGAGPGAEPAASRLSRRKRRRRSEVCEGTRVRAGWSCWAAPSCTAAVLSLPGGRESRGWRRSGGQVSLPPRHVGARTLRSQEMHREETGPERVAANAACPPEIPGRRSQSAGHGVRVCRWQVGLRCLMAKPRRKGKAGRRRLWGRALGSNTGLMLC